MSTTLHSGLSPTQKREKQPETFSEEQLIQIWEADAKDDLAWFLEYESRGSWQPAKHLTLLCDKLEAVERGEIKRLMVFMPPRHGKSQVVSKKFPAWYLGRNPNNEIIITSYAADLAYDFSRMARNTLRDWGHLWDVQLAADSSAVGRWGINEHAGALMAAGVGGPITGRGAHVAIIDDPLKNWEDALSETIRQKVWDWYLTTLRTRLAPGGAIVLVMTRWHEDDLAGRLLAEASIGGEKWEVISLAAEAEKDDPLGRKPGEWLWPERYPPAEYEDTKTALGTQKWVALYQQRPSPPEGSIIKRQWWQYYREPPAKFDEIIQSWDCAFKDLSTSDFVVGQVWGRVGAEYYLLDQTRDRMDFPATLQAVRQLTSKWPRARAKLIEDKANGTAVIQVLKKEIPGIIAVEPQGGKEARASAVSPSIEAGNAYLPQNAPWVKDFVDECAAFPNGAHDDQVDAMSQALMRFLRRPRIRGVLEKPKGW